STDTAVGTAFGTPAYMSPEQAEGRLDQLGPASDVYSLGAMLYTLLSGRAPFEYVWCDVTALLDRVRLGEFLAPRQVNTRVTRAAQQQAAEQPGMRAPGKSHEAAHNAESLRRRDAVSRVNLAYREYLDDNAALADDLLAGCPVDLRGWEWSYARRLGHSELRT